MTTARPIRTFYQRGDTVLKVTASGNECNAVANAMKHAYTDEYGASYILVYHHDKGQDLAILHRTPTQVKVLYRKASGVKRD